MKHKTVLFLSAALLLISQSAMAKWVKFSVDMTGQTISVNGVHVSGDFQDEAGYPADWESGTTTLTQESGTQIYSIKVNIPAFRKYEYKFVNGDQFYEVEFVPEKSRVGFDFNDNRWIYVDSLNTDTLALPALLYGGNAPTGMHMIRFAVDMGKVGSISTSGVHAGGTFDAWNVTPYYLWTFSNKVYEGMAYVKTGSYEYKFLNGRLTADYESVSGPCVNSSGNRTLTVSSDTVLSEVCFSSCQDCTGSVGIGSLAQGTLKLWPNPASGGQFTLQAPAEKGLYNLTICDLMGKDLMHVQNLHGNTGPIDISHLPRGVYLVKVLFDTHQEETLRLVTE